MKKLFTILFLNLLFFNYSYADKPWTDAMTIAKTKDKALKLIEKDK